MRKIIHRLKQSKRIIVASHINPDGDALGSTIAAALSLDVLGKNVTLYNESPIPAVYRFLPCVQRIVRHIDHPHLYDTLIILDCSDIERIGELKSHINEFPSVINIDHHMTNLGFGHLKYVDPMACATAEIIYRLIRLMEVPITRDIATAIYTGIFTDTGSFRFANTNKAAFSICNEMVEKGVEPYKVAERVYGTYSLGRIKLLNLTLDSIEISHDGRLSLMTLTQNMLRETHTRIEDADGIINYARAIEGVKVAVLIMEDEDGWEITQGIGNFHVSLRSNENIDVAELATHFGGGGHQKAAGFTAEMTLADLKSEIVEWFERWYGMR